MEETIQHKKLLKLIKIYRYNTSCIFYRAECEGLSIPAKTIKSAVNKLLISLKKLDED